jgi:hypothetical protein
MQTLLVEVNKRLVFTYSLCSFGEVLSYLGAIYDIGYFVQGDVSYTIDEITMMKIY